MYRLKCKIFPFDSGVFLFLISSVITTSFSRFTKTLCCQNSKAQHVNGKLKEQEKRGLQEQIRRADMISE